MKIKLFGGGGPNVNHNLVHHNNFIKLSSYIKYNRHYFLYGMTLSLIITWVLTLIKLENSVIKDTA